MFFVNVPLIIGIPFALEGGILDSVHSEKVDRFYIVLQMADFFFAFNSILIYSTLKRVCQTVSYLPESHKLKITQYKSVFLTEKSIEVDP